MVHPAAAPAFNPFSCPRCKAAASAAVGIQTCGGCGQTFVLRAGVRVDPNVRVPPIDPTQKQIKTTSAGMFVRSANIVAPAGVMQGTLDPVTGMIPMDTSGVAYNDLVSIAVWRQLDVVRLVLLVIICGPLALGLALGTIAFLPAAIATVPLLALIVLGFYQTIVIRKNLARIVGSTRILVVQFDAPMWRRQRFHDEMLRRAGLSPTPIP